MGALVLTLAVGAGDTQASECKNIWKCIGSAMLGAGATQLIAGRRAQDWRPVETLTSAAVSGAVSYGTEMKPLEAAIGGAVASEASRRWADHRTAQMWQPAPAGGAYYAPQPTRTVYQHAPQPAGAVYRQMPQTVSRVHYAREAEKDGGRTYGTNNSSSWSVAGTTRQTVVGCGRLMDGAAPRYICVDSLGHEVRLTN